MNSEYADDVCFWQVLKNGALTVDSFTYCDVDWHEYTSNSNLEWWSSLSKITGVSEEASGLVWSVLKYTDDEYVLIYRNKDKAKYTDLRIPVYSTEKGWDAPWYHAYGNEGFTTYNPTLSQDNYMKIQTLVVDHGIAGTSKYGSGMAGFVPVKVNSVNYGLDTIVYPSQFSAYEQVFIKSSLLKDVIWCHKDAEGNLAGHMSEFSGLSSLVDLRGFTTIGLEEAFSDETAMQNIVFAADVQVVALKAADVGVATKMFKNTFNIARIWIEGQTPQNGVADLTVLNITTIGQQSLYFNSTKIKTIKLPSTITTIKESSNALGSGKTVNFICDDAVAALIVANAKGSYAANVASSSINGTPISELIK